MDAVEALIELGGLATWAELVRMSSHRKARTAIAAKAIVRVAPDSYSLPGVETARVAAARLGGVVSHLSAAQHLPVVEVRRRPAPEPRDPVTTGSGRAGALRCADRSSAGEASRREDVGWPGPTS